MIRINLTGQRSRKGRRVAAAAVAGGGEHASVLLILLVLLAATVAVNGAWYTKLKRDGERIQADKQKADVEFTRLSQVKIRYQELEKEKALYQRRLEVIARLRASQSGPVSLLTMLGDTVNRTNEVWLDSMDDDGRNINLKGVALSIHGVANLMHNLQETGYFKTVNIKSSYQDEKVRDMQAFVFELNCQKQAPVAASVPATPPAKS